MLPWIEIKGFPYVRKYLEVTPPNGTIEYRAKIKLDGTNASIRLNTDGSTIYQSRTREISRDDDNFGFARLMEEIPWALLVQNEKYDMVIHGEWAGPGVVGGTSVAKIPQKKFFIFAIEYYLEDILQQRIVNPEEISDILNMSNDKVRILPWHTQTIQLNVEDENSVKEFSSLLNELVLKIEENDPYIAREFNVTGTGEGIVLYPVNDPNVNELYFKAKGTLHRVQATETAVPVKENAVDITFFVVEFLTEARCLQGMRNVLPEGSTFKDPKLTMSFINWIKEDIKKESALKLEVSGLSFKQVEKTLVDAARKWWFKPS